MSSTPFSILYINLERATERRRHIEEQIRNTFPAESYVMHRIPAVDGAIIKNDPHTPLSPHTQLVMMQRSRVRSHMQLESWGAVGCYLSHVACWEWLLAQSTSWCLVVEDDACFPPNFYQRVWQDPIVQSYIQEPFIHGRWDVVALGYFGSKGLDSIPNDTASKLIVRRIRNGGSFFGTQAYLLSRRGAAQLRNHAFPIEVQVDAYLLILQQIGWIKLFLIDSVNQCKGNVETGIDHWYNENAARPLWKTHGGWVYTITGLLLVLLIVVGLVRYRRGAHRSK